MPRGWVKVGWKAERRHHAGLDSYWLFAARRQVLCECVPAALPATHGLGSPRALAAPALLSTSSLEAGDSDRDPIQPPELQLVTPCEGDTGASEHGHPLIGALYPVAAFLLRWWPVGPIELAP